MCSLLFKGAVIDIQNINVAEDNYLLCRDMVE